jgi:hypothetical protein
MLFAAVHESGIGTKRTFAAPQHFVRYWTRADNGWILARYGLSAYDPKRTLAVHCRNVFDAGFSPYQSAHLSRYNPAS